jgi:hypothetical protein
MIGTLLAELQQVQPPALRHRSGANLYSRYAPGRAGKSGSWQQEAKTASVAAFRDRWAQ